MTTEDDFQAALDANPDDHTTRQVFADWLEEQGDVRAEGYRALGVLHKHSKRDPSDDYFQYASAYGNTLSPKHWVLPTDWFYQLPGGLSCGWGTNRRGAEDMAASAFAKLPAERRAELLTQPVPV